MKITHSELTALKVLVFVASFLFGFYVIAPLFGVN